MPEMRPEDVPQHYVDLAMPAWSANTSSRPGNWSAEGQVRAVLAAVLPALIGPDTAERIEQIQAERDALPDDERRRREAADAPLLRIQLAAYARKTSELEAELDRTSAAAARHIWREMGMSNLLRWKDRAEKAEANARAKVAEEFRSAAERIAADWPDPLPGHLWDTCAHDTDGTAIWDDPRDVARAALLHLADHLDTKE